MTHDRVQGLLSEYVDGTLVAADQRAVCSHLAACDDCRAEVEALRSLTADLRALPKEVPPPRGLWAEVARQTVPSSGAAVDLDAARAFRRRWTTGWRLAAAAVLLAACTSALTLYISSGNGKAAPEGSTLAAGAAVRVPCVDVAAAYGPSIQALRRSLEARRGELSPETVREIERNLGIIDKAIASAQTALARDPDDGDLIRTVSAMYEQKIALLQDANDLPDGS